ncbi:MAG: sodium:solute symporter [Porphyromonadaceae bacterium CG2_30_38_12]|nr:MAG: sodium:solute symporter [Porphyromonadaceae bacterium CG2_30_38_12]
MSGIFILSIIAIYFSVLLFIAYLTSKKNTDNDTFFRANRQSPWGIVAIGMVGSSISGVSFVSVPGMVRSIDFSYMQTVFGFFIGYVVISFVLLPRYYKLNLTSIYSYLQQRIGKHAYKTGAAFFLIAKTIGAAARLYVVTRILQTSVFDSWQVPYWITVCGTIFLIWLYTHRSGIKTIVWTDTLQAIIMLVALVLMVVQVSEKLHFEYGTLFSNLWADSHSRIFVFDDWYSKQHFVKQFFSGVFIAIVMTGLDQDMMQKNLTCRSIGDAQKNMLSYGFSFIPVNFLFLVLGFMLLSLANQQHIDLPQSADQILVLFATTYLGNAVLLIFIVGIIAAAFSSADSALAALTTSFSIDIMGVENESKLKATKIRKWIHIAFSLLFILIILLFGALNNKSIIDTIYIIASYTYGPLLGMYAFGFFTKRITNDKATPYIALSSPIICYLLQVYSTKYFSYSFGYELLMLNGFLTFVGLWAFSYKKTNKAFNIETSLDSILTKKRND